MNIEELKEKARHHEQREEWQKALDLYRVALRKQDEAEVPDISLLNRVGDIQTRLHQTDAAVEHYDKAIDLYLEAELPNNAIAICKKVLRNFPEQHPFFLRMGKIRANQGFLTDARQGFLTYAERSTAVGDIESALNALVEFVQLSPEDVEMRQSLASQLELHDRVEEAMEQYTEVYRLLVLSDRQDEAEDLARKLEELAPDLSLPDMETIRAEGAALDEEAFVVESTSLDGLEMGEEVEDHGDAAVEMGSLEIPDFVDASRDDVEAGAPASKDLAWDEVDEAMSYPGLESEEDEGEVEPLPILDLEEAAEEEEEEEAEEGEALELPPILDLEEAAEEEEEEEQEAWAPAPPDQVGVSDHQEAAESGDLDLAMEMVRDSIRSDPDSVELHQRLVEYAFRAADDAVLISAYLELAGCLERTGSRAKAIAVYGQVLALAPGHDLALQEVQRIEGDSRPLPPVDVASSQEYVDLGSMVLGDEVEKTTRWTVPADAPSGDDQADFAKMLSQFKEKVSEHLAVDDVAAHHDLGTAYMEMGLLDEAISEFQMALRASPDHLPTHEVMGRCWLEMERPDMVVRTLNRALQVPFEVEDELIGIYYLMGRAEEQLGNTAEALEFYEKVFSLDINFEDVTERLRALR